MPPKYSNSNSYVATPYPQNRVRGSPPASPRGGGRANNGNAAQNGLRGGRGRSRSRSRSPGRANSPAGRNKFLQTVSNNQASDMMMDMDMGMGMGMNNYDSYTYSNGNANRRRNSPSGGRGNNSMDMMNGMTMNQNHRGRPRSPSPLRGGRSGSASANYRRSPSPGRHRRNNTNNYDGQGIQNNGNGNGEKPPKRFIIYDMMNNFKQCGDYEGGLPGGAAKKAATRGFKKVLIFNPKMGKGGKYYVYDTNIVTVPESKRTPFMIAKHIFNQPRSKRCAHHDQVVDSILNNPKIMAILKNQQGAMRIGSDVHRARLANLPKHLKCHPAHAPGAMMHMHGQGQGPKQSPQQRVRRVSVPPGFFEQ